MLEYHPWHFYKWKRPFIWTTATATPYRRSRNVWFIHNIKNNKNIIIDMCCKDMLPPRCLADLVLHRWGPQQHGQLCVHTREIKTSVGCSTKNEKIPCIASSSPCVSLFHTKTASKLGIGQTLEQRAKCRVLCQWISCDTKMENNAVIYRNTDGKWESKSDLHQDKLKDKNNN
jgi:hypothetical protein